MERERRTEREREREREQKRERDGEIERGGGAHRVSHLSVHQCDCVTATSRSYRFLIIENSATALCGTTCIRDPKIKQNAQTICAAEEFEKNQTFTSSPFFAFAFAICFADLSLALAKSFSILSASFFASAWP